jgi:hypothetical protein
MNSPVQLEASRSDGDTGLSRRGCWDELKSDYAAQISAARDWIERECQEKARARLQEMGWANFEPRDDQQEFMYLQMVHETEWLERTIIARQAHRRSYIEEAFERERMEAFDLGRQLFFDPRGPGGIFGSPQFKRTEPEGPETLKEEQVDPAGLVARMELTVEGCRWLLNEWSALRAKLQPGKVRGASDNFKMTRLMGKRYLDALDDPELADVFLAGHAVDRRARNAFAELRMELRVDEIKERLRRMGISERPVSHPRDGAAGRERLIGIINRAEARLHAKVAEHQKRTEAGALEEALGKAFDESPAGKSIKRCEREHLRGISGWISALRTSRGMSEMLAPEGVTQVMEKQNR